MFIRKDYEAIAEMLNNVKPPTSWDRQKIAGAKLVLSAIIEDMAVYFASDNPNFDWDRFIKACEA